MEMDLKLYPAFVAAGLPAPGTSAERHTGGDPDYPGYYYLAASVRSVLPMMEQLGLITAGEMGFETLHEWLHDKLAGMGG